MDNRKQYCSRMSCNSLITTKAMISVILNTYEINRMLDVGCADGGFTSILAESTNIPHIIGIDSSADMIADAMNRDAPQKSRLYFVNESFDKYNDKDLDCVLFSSVLHEISSYCKDKNSRYLSMPIQDALCRANAMLNPNGIVVVRDMVKAENSFKNYVNVRFKNNEYFHMFLDFMDKSPFMNNPCMHYSEKPKCNWDGGGFIEIREDVLLEFLMVATWGKESFDREMQERKFILGKYLWQETFKNAGFIINMYLETNEEYPKYWRNIVDFENEYVFPSTTCLIVGQKRG